MTNYESFMTYQVCTAKSQSMSKECKMFRIVAKVLVTGESGVSGVAAVQCTAGVGPASQTFNSVVSVARGQRSQQTSKSTLDTFHPRFPCCLTVCVIYIKLFDHYFY